MTRASPSTVVLLLLADITRRRSLRHPVGRVGFAQAGRHHVRVVGLGSLRLRPVHHPDGTIWKVATSSKKNAGPATRTVDDIVLLVGATDVVASKKFYLDQGFTVAKGFGRKYVQFDAEPGHIKLALYGRRALAKDAGVSPDGSGSHRILIGSKAGPFVDPDGLAWEPDGLAWENA